MLIGLRGAQLIALLGTDRDELRLRVDHAQKIAIARIAGVAHQHALTRIQQQRNRQQQRARSPGCDENALGRHIDTILVRVPLRRSRRAIQATRRLRIKHIAAIERGYGRRNDRARSDKVGLANFEMHDIAPLRLERFRAREYRHDPKRFDGIDAFGKPRQA